MGIIPYLRDKWDLLVGIIPYLGDKLNQLFLNHYSDQTVVQRLLPIQLFSFPNL